MNTADKLIHNCYRPLWWKNTVYPYVLEKAMNRYFTHFPRNRCHIMDEDWDNLIILDACRSDIFNERNNIQGKVSYRLSKGSNTSEFFEGNFLDTEHHDTVYVTANPVPRVEKWCSVDIDSVFYKVVDVWEQNWDEGVNTVRPEPVSTAIKKCHLEYPNKRILGHFIQPHQPFIGDRGREIEEGGMTAFNELKGQNNEHQKKIWKKLEDGEISVDRVWQAYRENLDVVLPAVQELCDELTGKTVVTSDHGNLLGEFAWPFPIRKFGHPPGIHTKKLVKVPWLEIESETRRDTVPERPVQAEVTTDEEERLERLQDLGYY